MVQTEKDTISSKKRGFSRKKPLFLTSRIYIIKKNELEDVKMSIEAVRAYLAQYDKETAVREFDVSSATVDLAAAAVGVEGARICKTLAFQDKEGGCILVCAAGDGKISNRRFKDTFGLKAKMLSHDDTARMTGHAVGGVCPFALPDHVAVYCDESLKRFGTVFPAAGTANSAVELTPEELFTISHARSWVNVCDLPAPAEG